MRPRQTVKVLILAVLALGLTASLGNINNSAQAQRSPSKYDVFELSNELENKYGEINTGLRFQINDSTYKDINDSKIIEKLLENQKDFLSAWAEFKDALCESTSNNCEDVQTQSWAEELKNIDESISILEDKVKPFLEQREKTILSTSEYQQYREYLTELKDYEENKTTTQDKPTNPIQDKKNSTLEDLHKYLLNEDYIEKGAKEAQLGIFFRETQKALKEVSTKESLNIENNLLKINKQILTGKIDFENPGLSEALIKLSRISNLLKAIGLLTVLVLISILALIYRFNRSLSLSTNISENLDHILDKQDNNNREINNLKEKSRKSFKSLSEKIDSFIRDTYNKSSISTTGLSDTNINQESNNIGQRNNCISSENSSDAQLDNFGFTETETDRKSLNLDDIEKLVASYNKNPKDLLKTADKVTVTKETIEDSRSGVSTKLIFKKNNNYNYCVIVSPKTPGENHYLVPKPELVINSPIYQTVEDIFKCYGYENRVDSKSFELIAPAEVKFIPGNKYELLKPGKLRFEAKQ